MNGTYDELCAVYDGSDDTYYSKLCTPWEMFGVCMIGECLDLDVEADKTSVETTTEAEVMGYA